MKNENALPSPAELAADLVADLPRLVGSKRAAEVLDVHPRTLQRWIAVKRLRVVSTAGGKSGKTLVPRSEIERLLRGMIR